jgi:hypothetical protein
VEEGGGRLRVGGEGEQWRKMASAKGGGGLGGGEGRSGAIVNPHFEACGKWISFLGVVRGRTWAG